MGIGASIFLLAVGAILAFAVDFRASGIDINAVGVILMIVGAIGLAASFLFWDRMGFGGATGYRRTTVAGDTLDDPLVSSRRGAVRERRIVRDEEIL